MTAVARLFMDQNLHNVNDVAFLSHRRVFRDEFTGHAVGEMARFSMQHNTFGNLFCLWNTNVIHYCAPRPSKQTTFIKRSRRTELIVLARSPTLALVRPFQCVFLNECWIKINIELRIINDSAWASPGRLCRVSWFHADLWLKAVETKHANCIVMKIWQCYVHEWLWSGSNGPRWLGDMFHTLTDVFR